MAKVEQNIILGEVNQLNNALADQWRLWRWPIPVFYFLNFCLWKRLLIVSQSPELMWYSACPVCICTLGWSHQAYVTFFICCGPLLSYLWMLLVPLVLTLSLLSAPLPSTHKHPSLPSPGFPLTEGLHPSPDPWSSGGSMGQPGYSTAMLGNSPHLGQPTPFTAINPQDRLVRLLSQTHTPKGSLFK
jgi:hypothetical protein